MKTQLIQNIRSLTVITAISTTLLMSCQDTDYPVAQPSTSSYLTTARTLIVNASNATGITAFIENVAAGSTIAPGVNTGYIATPVSASDQVRIKNSGGVLGTSDVSAKAAFLANTSYTVFVTDTITRPTIINPSTNAVTDPGGVRLLTVTDTLTAPAAGAAKLRFFNLSPDVTGVASSTVAGPVSVRILNASGASVATFANRVYRTATGTTLRYTSVPAGTYVTQVYSGTSVPALTVTPVASSTVTMADGKIYTLYSQGLIRNNTLGVGVVQHN